MCDEDEIFEFLEGETRRKRAKQNAKIHRIFLRNSVKPFDMPDNAFVKRYRLTKELALELCNELRAFMPRPTKSTDLSIEVKVLIALSFYANGSYQRPTGDITAHSVAQQTVSTAIAHVTECLNLTHFRRKYIKFPANPSERRVNVIGFLNKFGMPGTLGCIDGTHVAIKRPRHHEERFYCRKQYHSLNVQVICNSNMKIISVDASNGGATHDSFIWNNHPLKVHMEELNNMWLLGDSGYPLRKTMMTPIIDAPPDSPEAYYTGLHVRTRNVVERSIGLLKARFRCLLVHRVLHYEPQVAASIVNACVVLHNICNRANVPVQELDSEEVLQETQLQPSTQNITDGTSGAHSSRRAQNLELEHGLSTRRQLIAHLWERRQVT